ncbi:SHUGOSHIN 2 [Diospyros lotus]|uniref:SHUGOSHIN 2 n=1 Tax=Diospyros lotus TaxID=55363 RepID=UPI0022564426|nr:SHUGOSHIN 2 [Diospyros lotus]
MKGDKMAKRSSFGSKVRKRLSDITNSIPQPKSPMPDKKPCPADSSAKEYIDHLVKENMALAKLIADKNKIIELTGIELQKMRTNLQKMQIQNWTLAQSNSHMIAELNLGKEKLKTLQHENVCKDALLKAKNLELEGKGKMKNSQKNCCEVGSIEGEIIDEHKSNDDSKPGKGGRRRSTRSQSMGSLTVSQHMAEKEASESKRRCLRRQSARFTSQQHEPAENLFEIADPDFLNGPMHEGAAAAATQRSDETPDSGRTRTSLGRPMRKAAEKVQSYKEIPIKIKLRRTE